MSRWNLIIAIVVLPVIYSGCSMCCGPYDYEYPMMENTRYPRMDPEYGRVGSAFSDPNVGIGVAPKTNADIPLEPEEPLEDIDGEGPDDPNFENLNPDDDTLPDPDNPSTDPFNDNIDTSASLNHMPRYRRTWR